MGGWIELHEERDVDGLIGDERENSRTMESSSVSGKVSSSSSSSSSKEEGKEESLGSCLGSAARAGAGAICVSSKEKSRSWVEIRERRVVVSSFVISGGLNIGGCGGGVSGRILGRVWGIRLAGGVSCGDSSRWIWVLLTKKSSRLSSVKGSGLGGLGANRIGGVSLNFMVRVSVFWTGGRGGGGFIDND